jgi:hypothetical protein
MSLIDDMLAREALYGAYRRSDFLRAPVRHQESCQQAVPRQRLPVRMRRRRSAVTWPRCYPGPNVSIGLWLEGAWHGQQTLPRSLLQVRSSAISTCESITPEGLTSRRRTRHRDQILSTCVGLMLDHGWLRT